MATIERIFQEVTGTLARSQLSAATFAELSDDESENTHRAISELLRDVNKFAALSAANIATRCDWQLGRESLARRQGYGTAEDLVQALAGGGGGSKTDARRLIETGTMATQAEAARDRQTLADLETEAHPELPPVIVEAPWFAPLGDAVAGGVLSTESAMVIRRGLGEPTLGVSETMLRDALRDLVAECATLNADQAAKAARHRRDTIDAAGIAARADAMRARQYLRVYTKPDGMLHGDFELDHENGAYFQDFLLQITGPRRGGPRFVEKGEKERAQRIIDDPRSTDQIAAESLIEVIKVAATADSGQVFGRTRPAVKLLVPAGSALDGSAPVGLAPVGLAPAGPPQSEPGPLFTPGLLEDTSEAVPKSSIDRLICSTGFTPILFNPDGQVLDVGREQRLFTAAQRAALAVRDGGCLWPGCTRPASWSEAHHLNGWSAAEGLTNLDDGILLCARDHLRLHNDGWQINRQRTQYWLTPPQKLDPARTPILLQSKAALRLQSPLRLRT